MRLIALTGAKGSGKSTVAEELVATHGFVRMRLADSLKAMLRTIGLTEAQIEGDEKELPCALLGGKTPRHAMQTLGTEWGRNLIHAELWSNILRTQLVGLMLSRPDIRVVVDDCRFPSEHAMLRGLGAEVWRLRRPSVEVQLSALQRALVRWGLSKQVHRSELFWPDMKADREVLNEGGFVDLRARINLAVAHPPIPVIPFGKAA